MSNKLFILFCIFLGIFIPLFVLWKNVFPSFEYELKNADSYGISIVKENLGDEQYFMVPVLGHYSFDKIRLIVRSLEKGEGETKVSVAKGYMVNAYPEGEPIRDSKTLKELMYLGNPDDIPNGLIFSYDNSAYVASRGKYYPILSAEVFELMGYKWDNVASVGSDIFNKLEKGEKINYMSPHPDGTIVKGKDGNYYLIWDKEKRKIENPSDIPGVWNDFYWVEIGSVDPQYFSTCEAVWKSGKMTCNFQINKALNDFGKTYIFHVDPAIGAQVENANVRFSAKANFDKNYLKYVLGEIKNMLFLRYGQYF